MDVVVEVDHTGLIDRQGLSREQGVRSVIEAERAVVDGSGAADELLPGKLQGASKVLVQAGRGGLHGAGDIQRGRTRDMEGTLRTEDDALGRQRMRDSATAFDQHATARDRERAVRRTSQADRRGVFKIEGVDRPALGERRRGQETRAQLERMGRTRRIDISVGAGIVIGRESDDAIGAIGGEISALHGDAGQDSSGSRRQRGRRREEDAVGRRPEGSAGSKIEEAARVDRESREVELRRATVIGQADDRLARTYRQGVARSSFGGASRMTDQVDPAAIQGQRLVP